MIQQNRRAAMSKAQFKRIENPEPVFSEIQECAGVWATGNTEEECRRALEEVLEEWVLLGVAWATLCRKSTAPESKSLRLLESELWSRVPTGPHYRVLLDDLASGVRIAPRLNRMIQASTHDASIHVLLESKNVIDILSIG
jgi:hypothetical protein